MKKWKSTLVNPRFLQSLKTYSATRNKSMYEVCEELSEELRQRAIKEMQKNNKNEPNFFS